MYSFIFAPPFEGQSEKYRPQMDYAFFIIIFFFFFLRGWGVGVGHFSNRTEN
jgi:hypothetical protein